MPNVKRTKMPKQKHVSMQVICLLDKNTHLKSIFDYHKASLVSQSSYCFRFGLPTACARKERNSRFNCDINRLYSVAYIPNLHYMRSQMPCYSRNVSEISSYDAAWISSNARSQTTNNNARLAFFFCVWPRLRSQLQLLFELNWAEITLFERTMVHWLVRSQVWIEYSHQFKGGTLTRVRKTLLAILHQNNLVWKSSSLWELVEWSMCVDVVRSLNPQSASAWTGMNPICTPERTKCITVYGLGWSRSDSIRRLPWCGLLQVRTQSRPSTGKEPEALSIVAWLFDCAVPYFAGL